MEGNTVTKPQTLTRARAIRMTTPDLVAVLLAGAADDDDHRRGALRALVGYNDGALLDTHAVRTHLNVGQDGRAYIQWYNLAGALDDENNPIRKISSTGFAALELAAALGANRPIRLRGPVGAWGKYNSVQMATAFALACGVQFGGRVHDDATDRLARHLYVQASDLHQADAELAWDLDLPALPASRTTGDPDLTSPEIRQRFRDQAAAILAAICVEAPTT
jgi:hypothetical protein